jgi:diacylglycerol kinase family enzyme
MKHVFLIKPDAKTYNDHPFVKMINEVMAGYDYEVRFSEYKDHVKEIIAEYPEKTRFYSVGGDGFLNQIIQCIVHTKHEVVCLPFGTGNDFSRTIHHYDSPEKILRESLTHQATPVDTVLVNDSCYYVNVGCFGIDALIANTVHEKTAFKVPRRKAYLVSVLKNIRRYSFVNVKIETDEGVLYDDRVTLCAFCNGRYYGGGFEISPQSYINDGWIDLVILPKVSRTMTPYYVYKILRRELSSCDQVIVKKLKECTVSTPASMNIDGEAETASSYHLVICEKSLNLVL